jgi:hypothetical protein
MLYFKIIYILLRWCRMSYITRHKRRRDPIEDLCICRQLNLQINDSCTENYNTTLGTLYRNPINNTCPHHLPPLPFKKEDPLPDFVAT